MFKLTAKTILDKEEINAITNKHFSQNVKAFELLKGGLFNTTYCIELENTEEKFVLRVEPQNRDKLLPFEENLAQAEAYVCELAKSNGVPANRLVVSDFSKEIIGRRYMIFSYIDGLALSDKAINKSNVAKLYEQTGEITSKFHKIQGEYYGRISDLFRGVKYSSWSEFVFSELTELQDACVKNKVISAEYFDIIQNIFKRGKKCFDTVNAPCLVHCDLWAGNVMVNREQNKVLALIDTDRCVFGDPDMDLASSWMINDDFIIGYGEIKQSKERELKLIYYKLLYAIIDAYVWKIEYCNYLNYKKNLHSVKRLVRKILKFYL